MILLFRYLAGPVWGVFEARNARENALRQGPAKSRVKV
jgi:hypothetical protein